ncbi:MAG: hypothetical protein LBS74_01395 [Oscillospiraceae bacterium]|jgi:hypothetical protein|nr:hypothetical protein [Oscillospiraceae bacterium]
MSTLSVFYLALSATAFLVFIVLLVFSILFFIRYKIPKVVGDLSGRTAKKSIEQMRLRNEQSGNKSFRPSAVNSDRVPLTEPIIRTKRTGKTGKRGHTSGATGLQPASLQQENAALQPQPVRIPEGEAWSNGQPVPLFKESEQGYAPEAIQATEHLSPEELNQAAFEAEATLLLSEEVSEEATESETEAPAAEFEAVEWENLEREIFEDEDELPELKLGLQPLKEEALADVTEPEQAEPSTSEEETEAEELPSEEAIEPEAEPELEETAPEAEEVPNEAALKPRTAELYAELFASIEQIEGEFAAISEAESQQTGTTEILFPEAYTHDVLTFTGKTDSLEAAYPTAELFELIEEIEYTHATEEL